MKWVSWTRYTDTYWFCSFNREILDFADINNKFLYKFDDKKNIHGQDGSFFVSWWSSLQLY